MLSHAMNVATAKGKMMSEDIDDEEYQRNFNKKMMAYAERLFLTMDLEADKSADCLIKAFKDHVKEQDEEKRDD